MSYNLSSKIVTCDMGRCPVSGHVRDNEPGQNLPVSGRIERIEPLGQEYGGSPWDAPPVLENWTMVGTGDLLADPESANYYCPEHG